MPFKGHRKWPKSQQSKETRGSIKIKRGQIYLYLTIIRYQKIFCLTQYKFIEKEKRRVLIRTLIQQK